MENDTEIDTTDLMEAFLAQCRRCKSDMQREDFIKNTYLMSADDDDDADIGEEKYDESPEDKNLEELEETDTDLKELGIDINKLNTNTECIAEI